MSKSPFTVALVCLSGFSLMVALAQDVSNESSLEALESNFREQLAEVGKPLADLKVNFVKALDRLGKKRQSVSDFEGMMAVKKEKERIDAGAEPARDTAVDEEIETLRVTLEREHIRIKGTLRNAELQVYQNYESELLKQKTLLTKQGDLNAAIAASEAAGKIREAIDAGFTEPEAGGRPHNKVLWSLNSGGRYETAPGLSAEKTLDGVVLRMDGTRGEKFITFKETFTPPYRIHARVSTDSTNIRFKFGPKGRVIFNWEVKQTELRIHHYDTGKITPVRDTGLLDVNQIYDIEIDVTAEGIEVKADRKERGTIESPVSLTEGAISIGPGFGSVVTIEELEVLELEGN